MMTSRPVEASPHIARRYGGLAGSNSILGLAGQETVKRRTWGVRGGYSLMARRNAAIASISASSSSIPPSSRPGGELAKTSPA